MKEQQVDKPAPGRLARAWMFAILLLVPQLSLASLDPGRPLHQFTVQNWQAEQGLPQNSILSIAQTADGYLWAGTEEGLARYDGVRFVTFDTGNSRLVSNLVRTLLVDHQNTLWIGNQNGGLTAYQDGEFKPVPIAGYSAELSVNTIFEDHSARLWIGTGDSGLIRIGKNGSSSFTTKDGLLDDHILALDETNDGTLWIVTRKGLSLFHNRRFSSFGVAEGLASNDVRAIKVDHQGTVWVATGKGLNRISDGNIATFTSRDGLASDDITSVNEDRNHTLWIGTRNGLSRFAQGKFTSLDSDPVVSGTDIGTIFEDRQGDMWFGTGGHGLLCVKEGAFRTITTEDGLSSDSILPVFEDRDRNLWIGSEHGLTKRAADGQITRFTTKDGLHDDFVFSVTQDLSGAIWVATRSGISKICDKKVIRFATTEDWSVASALALFTDRSGRVWIGNRMGLKCFDGHSTATYTKKNGLPEDLVTSIQEGPQGTLWLGTSAGLSKFADGKFRNYTMEDGLASNYIMSIYCDPDNVLWIATSKGLSRFRAGRITSYAKLDRALEGLMSVVLEDRKGFLWLSSNRGIVRVSKRELTRYAEGVPGQQVHPVFFDRADGMKKSECNGGFQPAGWVGKDGKLYFPTVAGVAITDPSRPPTPRGGAMVLEHLVVNDREYPPRKSAVVPAGPGKLEIQFSSPDLHYQDRVLFRYMLDGFDKEWVNSQTRRVAYYTNLPHGEYRFRVQSGVNGIWSDGPLVLPLTLEPHFYETQPFYLFVAIAVMTIAGATYRVRMDQIAARELRLRELVNERTFALRESEAQLRQSRDELEQRVIERTKELTETNSYLEEEILTRRRTEELLVSAKDAAEAANRAKSEFLANISHELRTPINGILGMTEIALTTDLDPEQTEYLEVAKTSADSLLSIVNDILDFSTIEARKLKLENRPFHLRSSLEEIFRSQKSRADRKGLSFALTVDSDVPDSLVGDSVRIRQVLLNLYDNALKFTTRGSILLSVTSDHCQDEYVTLHFAMKDTGIGIAPDKTKAIFEAFSQADNSSTRRYGGTGLGLTISREMALMLGGELSVESVLGVGSTFHFTARLQVVATNLIGTPPSQYDAPLTV